MQTGRSGSTPHYSADLYSLGAILYHLACGHPPFQLEQDDHGFTSVHALAAFVRAVVHDKPRPLCEHNPLVSQFMSNIIAKLLAKTPGDRYLSAYGAWRDFQQAAHIHEQSTSSSPRALSGLEIGQRDIACVPNFTEPGVPDGRSMECAALDEAVDVAATSEPVLVCIRGPNGVGKSSLLRYTLHFHGPREDIIPRTASASGSVVSGSGTLIKRRDSSSHVARTTPAEDGASTISDRSTPSAPDTASSGGSDSTAANGLQCPVKGHAKCDAAHSATPYFPVVTALSAALKAFLAAPASVRSSFTQRLAGALRHNVHIAIETIAMLKLYFKDEASHASSAVHALSPEEEQNTLRQCLLDVLVTLSCYCRPLIIAIDDIQVHATS